ncbi:MAG: M16 family metallopeptidase, partial [Calditrichia bacterium]
MPKKSILSLVFLVFFISWTVRAQQHDAAKTIKSTDENVLVRPLPKGVSIHQLDNGMQVLLIENRALPMVGVNVVVKVGSAYETFASSGMSHMLEHLLFNGTTTRTQKKLYDDVDRIGGYNNANTSQFYTNYMMVTPAEHIKKGMEIQADMLFNSILPEEKFEKEKGIVLEEIARSLGNSSEQLERNINSILYRGHALSLPILGTYATIESMSRDAVNAFYHNNYVPNNMILSAIGNFRADSMLAWIKQYYGSAPPGVVKHEEMPRWSTGFQKPHLEANYADSVYYRFYGGDDIKLELFYQLPPGSSAEFLALLNLGLGKQVDSLQSVLQAENPDQVKSIQLNTRSSVLKNYLQVTLNLLTGANADELTRSVNRHLREMKFSISPDAVSAQAVKARTNFLKNVEKPHMFGIFNADGFAIGGIESVLASYSGEGYPRAASQLKNLKLSGRPLIIVQYPIARVEGAKVQAAGQSILFEAQNGGATLIAKQNESSDLLAIHYLVKHKARFEFEYGKDAAKVLHSCLEERLKSDENQKLSNRFGFTYKFNDNPFFPMDNIYLHPDFGYIRVEGLADDLPGAI